MKYNKGFLGIVITIIVSLVVGGGVVYYVTKTKTSPLQNVVENNNQINEQDYNPSTDDKKNPPNIPILTQEQAENLVYKKWGDCSQGDCGGVVVTLSQNNIGQYVITAIFTQLDDSTSQSKRISIASYQNGTWTLGQPVVTQMCHRGNADGTTGWTAGLCI